MGEYQADSFGRGREVSIQVTKQQSPRAKWALWLAMPFFVPLLPFIGMVTGWLAMRDIAGNAAHTGIGRAKLAVFVGLAFTIVQGVVGYGGWQYANAADDAPEMALKAGMSGDLATFMSQFNLSGSAEEMEDAGTFLTLVEQRYGDCQDAELKLPSKWYTKWRPFDAFSYDLRFSSGNVRATAQIVMKPNLETFGMPRMSYFQVHDANLGDLRFPPDAKTKKAMKTVAGADQD